MSEKIPLRTGERGYTLAVVAVFTTILLVTLTEAAINWQKAIQREREEELIFRGKQYMRAVELWQRKFPGTYPITIDALLSTSNTRFLRKKWKDPVTNTDDWRLIKLNADGSISGATLTPGASPLGPSSFGSSSSGPANRSQASTTGTVTPTTSGRQQSASPQSRGGQSAFNPVLGGIVGVASKSEKEGIKTYNGRSKYNEWEFVFIPRGPVPGQPSGPQQPTQGGPRQPGTSPPGPVPQQPGQVSQPKR